MVLIETNVLHSLRNRVLFQDGSEICGFGGRDSCMVDAVWSADKVAPDPGNAVQDESRAVIGDATFQIYLADQGCGVNGVVKSLFQRELGAPVSVLGGKDSRMCFLHHFQVLNDIEQLTNIKDLFGNLHAVSRIERDTYGVRGKCRQLVAGHAVYRWNSDFDFPLDFNERRVNRKGPRFWKVILLFEDIQKDIAFSLRVD